MFTNLPEDVITNTFHFDPEPLVGLQTFANSTTPMLHDFYESAYALGGMANYVNLIGCYTKWYDLDMPEPRLPFRVALPTLAGVSAISDVPTEVSCVLSFEGVPVPGVPLGRQRGRIYLGALGQSWMTDSTSSSFPTFATASVNAVAGAANALQTAIDGAGLGEWVVLSPTAGQTFRVNNGHVDNTPDTQRRRGVKATSRQNWT